MTDHANLSTFLPEGRAGMPDEFQNQVEPYAREILVHCYRFFGSLEDAEDALQETLLRAWRRMDTLKEPAALRGWLYRIATNVSLDLLQRSKARALPSQLSLPADPGEPLAEAQEEWRWLEPLPDELLDTSIASVNSALQRARLRMSGYHPELVEARRAGEDWAGDLL